MLVSQKQLTVYIEKYMRSLGMTLPLPWSTSRAMRTRFKHTWGSESNLNGAKSRGGGTVNEK